MILLNQMIIFFLIMEIGFYCGKKNYIGDEGIKNISWLVVNVGNPALILGAGMEEATLGVGSVLKTLFIAFIVYLLLIIVSIPIGKILRASKEDADIYRIMIVFSNIGFMGFPILHSLYGAEALIYGSLFLFPYNILIYTYGIKVLEGGKENKKVNDKSSLLKMINVGTISCAFSLIIYLAGIPVHDVIKTATGYLGNLTAPLSMIVIGFSMSRIELTELFTDKRMIVFSLIKQIVIPIIGMLIIKAVVSDKLLVNVCYIMLATPVGSMVAMLAQEKESNSRLASKAVSLTTLISVITIPIIAQIV